MEVSNSLTPNQFKYISGANANNTHVPMAAPVLTEIIPAPDSDIPVFQVSFFVPFEFQDDPPAPSDSSVFVVEDPKTTVNSRRWRLCGLNYSCREQFINSVDLRPSGVKLRSP